MKIKCLLLLTALLLLSSCARNESTISISEETVAHPSTDGIQSALYVNVNTEKIHYHPDCRNLKGTWDESITIMTDTNENRKSLIDMGFLPCDNCSFPNYSN